MTDYISTPVPQDRPAVRQVMDDELATQFSGAVVAAPGTLLDFQMDTFAGISAQDRQLMTSVLASVFKYSGEKIDRVPIGQAVPATADSTFTRTAADALANPTRLVAAGFEVTLPGVDGNPVSFVTTADFSFTGSATTTSTGAVGLIASAPGTAGNDLLSGAQPAQTTTWWESTVLTGATAGGEDAEDDGDYLNRLADTRPLQLNAIAKAGDLSRWLRNQPAVDTALVLDNYNGSTPNQPGHITAWVRDPEGNALSGGVMTALQLAAQTITLTNLIVHVLAPVYTTIAVAWTAVAEPTWDASDVEARAESAVFTFIDRSRWGLAGSGDVRAWLDKRIVRFQDISTVLNNVEGFDYWDTFTINGDVIDVAMPGPGALPKSDSTAAGTVTAS